MGKILYKDSEWCMERADLEQRVSTIITTSSATVYSSCIILPLAAILGLQPAIGSTAASFIKQNLLFQNPFKVSVTYLLRC